MCSIKAFCLPASRMMVSAFVVLIMLIYPKGSPAQGRINAATENPPCQCDTKVIRDKSGNYFYPQLQTFAKYSDFEAATGWKLKDKGKGFSLLFAKNYRTNPGTSSLASILSVLSFKAPIEIVHSNATFILNLTPCVSTDHVYELPLVVNFSESALKYDRAFDYKKFDHSAKSYLHMFILMGAHPEDILKQLLQNMIGNDDKKLKGFKGFINNINQKYDLNIEVKDWDRLEAIQKISSVTYELEAGKIRLENFINDEFIVTESAPHTINAEEQERLRDAVGGFINFNDFKEFDNNFLKPQYIAGANTKRIGIEINKKILQKWDEVKNQAVPDSAGDGSNTQLLANVSKIDFGSRRGLRVNISAMCEQTCEITGTGITLDIKSVRLIDEANSRELREFDYPLFKLKETDARQHVVDGVVIAQYDSLLNNFSGLRISSAKMYIPFNKNLIAADITNLIVN